MTAALLLAGLLLTITVASLALRHYRAIDSDPLVDAIDLLLPQTQCAQCGYPGCRPYAQALAEGKAEINLCAPGGQPLVQSLHALLSDDQQVAAAPPVTHGERAFIREEACIGCALCLVPCPVDAIVGAPGYMHTVITDQCTGCELCVPACPVDCIDMLPGPDQQAEFAAPMITLPLVATSSAVELTTQPAAPACIRCGACDAACPVSLPAQSLLELVQLARWDGAEELQLSRCIECGLCDEACPADIPLEQHFAHGKQVLAAAQAEARTRRELKSRHSDHQHRLQQKSAAQKARRQSRLAGARPWQQ